MKMGEPEDRQKHSACRRVEYGLRNKARILTGKKEQTQAEQMKMCEPEDRQEHSVVAEWLIRPPKVPVCQALKERIKLAMKMSSRWVAE
ncbi:hypothetical protein MTR67_023136 [Solanum verrucosum]|uniref:Uncharacterized protein n=1 Tax=Solanum verrucosum TaxID=315347 RepID=A0AAF0TRJ8_SOLVR|nr:hypothetical protein MTR67_023136 [Solanum verrucosum]